MLPSISDIAKLLEQIPIWKSLTSLPKRVAVLEGRLATLEKGGSSATPDAPVCHACKATLVFQEEQNHPHIPESRSKIHIMRCDNCDKTFNRTWNPAKGYK